MSERRPMPAATSTKSSADLPRTLTPYFQEYDFDALDPERDAVIIIERTLEHGDRSEIIWLFQYYGEERIREVVQERGARHLLPQTFAFWRLILNIDDWRPHPWAETAAALWRP